MFSKTIVTRRAVLAVVLGSVALLSQPTPAEHSSSAGLEFPVIMRQNVVSGTTPVGTKIQAKLAFATLVGRVVVPQDAILSGDVTESAAKSVTDASRLGIRMDSAQWKNGSVPIKVYLTAWFYPLTQLTNQDSSYEQPDGGVPTPRRRRGADTYPYPNTPASQPFPGRGTGTDPTPPPPSPEPGMSKHRVLMKDVESTRNNNGAITLTSKRFNIKLDKATTYVLAGDQLPAN
jgi:hypothetical protein